MGLEKIVRYTCSTKVSSFIPMVLNAVATVLCQIYVFNQSIVFHSYGLECSGDSAIGCIWFGKV